jgi:restriction endonuclease S subunit
MNFKAQPLASIADIKTGLSLRGAAVADPLGDATLVQMKDVDPFDGVTWENVIRINTEGRRNLDWLQENDILFVGRGSRFFAVHVKNVAKYSLASPHFYVIRVAQKVKILPEFLVWYLNSQISQKFYAANQEGSALPYISRKTLDSLSVPLPELEKQHQIVKLYGSLQKQQKLMEELLECKNIYINKIIEKSLTGVKA